MTETFTFSTLNNELGDNTSVWAFYDIMKEDEYFNFFQHSTLDEIVLRCLEDEMEVHLGLVDGKVAAWGQIQKFTTTKKSHVARLGFAVHPHFRRNGFGQKMFDYILALCYDGGYYKLTATTRRDNSVMSEMFEKANFEVEGVFKNEEFIRGDYKDVISWAKFI